MKQPDPKTSKRALARKKASRIPRTDKYGNSGMGENYSGVFNKDKQMLKNLVANSEGALLDAIPATVNKRGNIKEYIPFYNFG